MSNLERGFHHFIPRPLSTHEITEKLLAADKELVAIREVLERIEQLLRERLPLR